MRQYLRILPLSLTLLLVAGWTLFCERAPRRTGADASPGAPSDGGGTRFEAPPTGRAPERLRRRERSADAGAPPRAVHPTDEHVLRCVQRATDKASLMGCLAGVRVAPTQLDAGVRFAASRPPIINPAWAVPSWYVRGATGNDNSTCTDAAHACKTCGEIVARWGTSRPMFTGNVWWQWLEDTPSNTDWCELRPIMLPGSLANFVGSSVTDATATLSSLAAKNRSSGLPLKATIGAGSAGSFLHNGTHTSNAWLDSLSGPTATITQPFATIISGPPASAWSTAPSEVDAWASTDSVTVEHFTKVNLTAFDPEVVDDGSSSSTVAMLGHVWIPSSGAGFFRTNANALLAENRIDQVVASDPGEVDLADNLLSNFLSLGGQIGAGGVVGGSADGLVLLGSAVDGDAILHGAFSTGTSGASIASINAIGQAYADSTVNVVGGHTIVTTFEYGAGQLYGTYTLNAELGGAMFYDGTAPSVFTGAPTLQINGASFANALDRSVDPAQLHPHRTLSPAQLGASVASGGFGDIAYSQEGQTVFASTTQMASSPSPSPFVLPPANGGTGVTGCPSGEFLGNTPLGCATPSGGSSGGFTAGGDLSGSSFSQTVIGIRGDGVPTPSSGALTWNGGGLGWNGCAGDITCSFGSPNTTMTLNASGVTPGLYGDSTHVAACVYNAKGQATSCSNVAISGGGGGGAVSSVNAGSGILVSPITGAVTVSLSTPVTVSSGGTGNNAAPADAVAIGNGTSPFLFANTVTVVGEALVSQGSGTPPAFGLTSAAGGGTGNNLSSCMTSGSGIPLVTDGISKAVCSNPTATGQVLLSTSSTSTAWQSLQTAAMNQQIAGLFDSNTVTLTSNSLRDLVTKTVTTGSDVIIDVQFEITSQDTIANAIQWGETTDSNTSIVNAFNAGIPVSSGVGAQFPGVSVFDYQKKIHLGALTPGSHTFHFLIQPASTPTALLTVRVIGSVLF